MSDNEELIPRRYPPWEEAIKQFEAAGFKYGDLIEFDWFFKAFDIEVPDLKTMTGDKVQKLDLAFLTQFEPFRNELLEAHQIDLVNERGVGYRIAPPGKQSKLAYEDGIDAMRKAFRKTIRRITNANTSLMTMEERKENAELMAKMDQLRRAHKEVVRRRLLPPPEETEVKE